MEPKSLLCFFPQCIVFNANADVDLQHNQAIQCNITAPLNASVIFIFDEPGQNFTRCIACLGSSDAFVSRPYERDFVEGC
jgi:hypothetical protein